jgi:imidazolonepropionase-like amidohydrolase
MNFRKNIFIFICFSLSIFATYAQNGFPLNGPPDIRPNYVAITNVTIQVDPKTSLKNATLILLNGKIENVGVQILIPKEARVINGKGKYIYPSFIDLYSSYGINDPVQNKHKGNQFSNNLKGAYTWNDAVRLNLNAVDFFQYDEKKSKQYLSSGFGSTLSGIHDGIFRGSAAVVLTSKGPEQKLILKGKAAGEMSFNKGSSLQDYPSSMMGVVSLIRQTYLDANWYNLQKVETNLSFENFNQIKKLPTIFEAENKLAVLRAGKIGKEFGVAYWIKGNGDEYQRLEEIAKLEMPLILPLNFPKVYEVEDPFDAIKVSLNDLKHWEMAPANAGMVAAKSIPFVLTSFGCADATEFLKNLRKAVEYGLSEENALAALTIRPAQWLQIDQQIGSLQKGKLANFFISNEPIFSQNATIEEHWIKGEPTVLKKVSEFKLEGNYELSLKGFTKALLNISKKDNGLEAQILAKDTLKVAISEQAGIFTFSFKDSLKGENLIRVQAWVSLLDSARYQVKNLQGNATLTNGDAAAFAAVLVSVRTEKTKLDSNIKSNIGKVLFPFTEYGNESLPKQQNYLFKNVTVWTNEQDGIINDVDVAVSNGKISAIGKGLNLPNYLVIDAKGKQLTSGIIDEHSHIAIYRGVNECTQNNTAEVRIGDVINSDDINIYRQLSGGVIACQQLHGSCNPIGGQSSIIKLRWGMAPEEMKIANADGFIKFALGENVKQSNWNSETGRYPQTRMGVEQVYYDAFIRARAYEAAMKADPKLTRRDLEQETILEILNKKRFISCHSYVQSEINMLMHVADSMGFKVNTFTHILEGYKVADKMKALGVSASTFADWWAYKYEVIDAIPQNAVILNKMGVVTAINSDDAEMGRRLNQEAAKMIKYGNMSEVEAWKMVTLNPAKMLHIDKQTGSVKVGKDADLVLWSANPLSIEAKAEMTLVDGVCYFSREQDLAKRINNQKERERIIQKMLLAKIKGEKAEHKVSALDPDYHCED